MKSLKAVGIICEYSPFHNGHLYHINKIKELYPDHLIVLVMSGNYTQRGLTSILNKWDKTELALTYGVNLVVELPFVFATQSADIFAKGAISILKELQVEYLVFGSECNCVEELIKLAHIQLENPEYERCVKNLLKTGINYPTAMSMALKQFHSHTITSPNDLLGLSYVKEIVKQKANIVPVTIQRTNDFHDTISNEEIVSATRIRKALKESKTIENFVPAKTYQLLQNHIFQIEDYFPYLFYKINLEQKMISHYQTVDEGIENRILKYLLASHSIQELIENIKTKRYTYNKLMRMIIHILCGFTKEEAKENQEISYLRILGMTNDGQKYLSARKKEIKFPIITAINQINNSMLEIEYRSTCVYALTLDTKNREQFILREFNKKPIIK